jgi:hypothetical protein
MRACPLAVRPLLRITWAGDTPAIRRVRRDVTLAQQMLVNVLAAEATRASVDRRETAYPPLTKNSQTICSIARTNRTVGQNFRRFWLPIASACPATRSVAAKYLSKRRDHKRQDDARAPRSTGDESLLSVEAARQHRAGDGRRRDTRSGPCGLARSTDGRRMPYSSRHTDAR